jgi:glycosylphosphatidylinositol transamidase (GPIT) subunit GPI8
LRYDDVANDPKNPAPGTLINKPNGTNVYKDIKIDYKGDDVNPSNFVAVLKGDAAAVRGGNGKVLNRSHSSNFNSHIQTLAQKMTTSLCILQVTEVSVN